jgi:hypothetical protein
VIVDHFLDLFEVQQEFLPIAQKVLPYFRGQVPSLFPNKVQQDLAWRLLKLLILVHLSPRREDLGIEEAAQWLVFRVSTIDPEKNREIVRKALDTLARKGSYIKQQGTRYQLDLKDDRQEQLEQLMSRTIGDLRGRGDSLFESLIPLLQEADFNPFALPRDRWFTRTVRWHFHDRNLQVYVGGGVPPEPGELSLQIGLPWGPRAEGKCYGIQPAALEATAEVLEAAALQHLNEKPLPAPVLSRIRERIAGRRQWFSSLVRTAYLDAAVTDPAGAKVMGPLLPLHGGHSAWLNAYGEWILKQTYPLFERFAPVSGPLHKNAYRQFMRFVSEHDLGARRLRMR